MRRTCRSTALAAALWLASVAGPGCEREPAPAPLPRPAADSTRVERQRIVALEADRNFGGGVLVRDLHHPDARVRRAAAIALGRIQDPAALVPLLGALADPDTTVAERAAFALGQLKGLDDNGRHALQAELVPRVEAKPRPWLVPYVEALAKQGGPEIVAVLEGDLATGLLASMGSEAREPVLEGTAAWGVARVNTPLAHDVLKQVGDLRNRRPAAAWRIAGAMMAYPDTAYRTPLLSLLDHDDATARAAGARALGRQKDRTVLPMLVQHLSDIDWRVRASLLIAIGELTDPKHPSKEAGDFAAALLSDSHPLVREAAANALNSLQLGTHAELLRPALTDSVAAVRLAALRCAAHWQHAAARPAWEAARRDRVDFVRTEALRATADVLGAAAAIQPLLTALAAPDVRERMEAATALGDVAVPVADQSRVRAALEKALQDPDFVVATLAATALGSQHWIESAAALGRTYDAHHTTHNDNDIRLACVEAGRDCVGKKRRPEWTTLKALFDRAGRDPDRRIVQAGRAGLARLAGQDNDPPPLPLQARDVPLGVTPLPEIDLGAVQVRLVTAHGSATLELDGDQFPRTVGNFLHLVDSGFYSQGVFHRVVPAFVVQGGCPRGDGWGDAGSWLPCEYGELRYDRPGVVGMATAGKDTGGSQFFITHVPVPRLDGNYTAFGRVLEGMDVVDKIVRGDAFHIERVAPATAGR